MNRPPRQANSPLFTWALIGWSVLQGTLVFALVALVFVFALRSGMPTDESRALAFFSLVVSIFGLVLVNRSFSASFWSAFSRPNAALVWVLLAVMLVLAATLVWPPASSLFRFGPLHLDDLTLTLGAGLIVLVVLELLKPFWSVRLRS
jgi:Ca2+-transporting ATPase